MKIEELYLYFLETTGVTTDTRKIEANNFFIALKGDTFNGNEFAQKAIELGAKYALIDESKFKKNDQYILVDNCLETLQKLANYHRQQLPCKIIGLTGSNGKTTTKELIYAVLSQKYKTQATFGNLNNHIGVPLTLLSFRKDTEMGIVEMGANHQKEIEFLCQIAQPDFGYITNFGKAHLEGFGGVEGVIKGKSELYDYLASSNHIAFINNDDPLQVEKTKYIETISFGLHAKNNFVTIDSIEANPMVKIKCNNTIIQSHLIGLYNANNIYVAITIGSYFNIPIEIIKQAIENYIPTNNRSQLLQKETNTIILDAYNANPSSMQAALTNFFQLEEENKIAILGDMFELGEESFEEHKKIVELCKQQDTITFYFIGKEFLTQQTGPSNLHFYASFENFQSSFTTKNTANAFILIKGSRGMRLERALDCM